MSGHACVEFLDRTVSGPLAIALLHFLWQGIVIAAVVFVADLMMRNASPRSRYLVFVFSLVAMACCLPLTLAYSVSSVSAERDVVPIALPEYSMSDLAVSEMWLNGSSDRGLHSPVVDTSGLVPIVVNQVQPGWASWCVVTYLCGVMLMLARLALSVFGVAHWRLMSVSVTDDRLLEMLASQAKALGLRRRPTLATCERLMVPVAAGIFFPTILLPASLASGLTANEIKTVLLHELSHIKRGDLLVNLLQRFAESILFFHPAVWYVSQKVTVVREHCCDDEVLRRCTREDYASAMIRMAERFAGTGEGTFQPVTAIAASGASPTQLKRRVMRILGVKTPRPFDRSGFLMFLSCLLIGATVGVSAWAQSSDETQASDQQNQQQTSSVVEESNDDAAGLAEQEDVARVVQTSEGQPGPVGPVRIEFIPGTDTYVVRGAKEDVDRVIKILDDVQAVASGVTPAAITNQQEKVPHAGGVRSHYSLLKPEVTDSQIGIALRSFAKGKGYSDEDLTFRVSKTARGQLLFTQCKDQIWETVEGFLGDLGWIEPEDWKPDFSPLRDKDGKLVKPEFSLGLFVVTSNAKQVRDELTKLFPLLQINVTDDGERKMLSVFGPTEKVELVTEAIKAVDAETARLAAEQQRRFVSFRIRGVKLDPIAQAIRRMIPDMKVAVDEGKSALVVRGSDEEIEAVSQLLKQLGALADAKAEERKGLLGVFVRRLSTDLRIQLNLKVGEGVVVDSVAEGSPAGNAGLLPHDVLIEFGGEKVTYDNFENVVARRAGLVTRLEYIRVGKKRWTALQPNAIDEPEEESQESGDDSSATEGAQQDAVEQAEDQLAKAKALREVVNAAQLERDEMFSDEVLAVLQERVLEMEAVAHAQRERDEARGRTMAKQRAIDAFRIANPGAASTQGRQLYRKHCVHCHGERGDGQGPTAPLLSPTPRDFASSDYRDVRIDGQHAKQDLRQVIRSGRAGTAMPSFERLSDDDLNSLVEYVRFLSNGYEVILDRTTGGKLRVHRGLWSGSEGSLRFPEQVEQAMMFDSMRNDPVHPLRFPQDLEKGMMLDSIDRLPIRKR